LGTYNPKFRAADPFLPPPRALRCGRRCFVQMKSLKFLGPIFCCGAATKQFLAACDPFPLSSKCPAPVVGHQLPTTRAQRCPSEDGQMRTLSLSFILAFAFILVADRWRVRPKPACWASAPSPTVAPPIA